MSHSHQSGTDESVVAHSYLIDVLVMLSDARWKCETRIMAGSSPTYQEQSREEIPFTAFRPPASVDPPPSPPSHVAQVESDAELDADTFQGFHLYPQSLAEGTLKRAFGDPNGLGVNNDVRRTRQHPSVSVLCNAPTPQIVGAASGSASDGRGGGPVSQSDAYGDRVERYGGARPYDTSNTLTSDFRCLDLRAIEWKDISPSLRFHPAGDKDLEQLDFKKLPALMEPATALTYVSGGTYNPDSQGPTADLIAIDLNLFIWWYIDVRGTPIVPRLSASMVAIKSQLFIFGGRSKWEDDSPGIGTYSIAPFTLSPDTSILFHIQTFTFRTVSETVGNFASGPVVSAGFYGGRVTSPKFPPSVVVIAWVRCEQALVPEILQYLLPLAQIRCLDLHETFWNLNLHSFAVVGNRMLLNKKRNLGY
ncbi:hypothetical protein B0H14DRAFT_2571772 [Mycena olivaceomarginata]|nr:hypothetical protein B0H14DRAFT_2571772 [Mycena olivaceomarginata]